MPLTSSYDNLHQPPTYNWELRLTTTGEIWDQPRPSSDFCDLFDLGHTDDARPTYGFGMDQFACHGAHPRKEHTDAWVCIHLRQERHLQDTQMDACPAHEAFSCAENSEPEYDFASWNCVTI